MSIRGVAAGDCLQAVSRERGTSSGWGHALVNSKHSPQYMGSDIATCHDIPYIDSLPIPPCPHKRDKEQYIRLHHWRYAFTFSMHQRPSKGCDTAWLLLLLGVCGAWAGGRWENDAWTGNCSVVDQDQGNDICCTCGRVEMDLDTEHMGKWCHGLEKYQFIPFIYWLCVLIIWLNSKTILKSLQTKGLFHFS